MMWTALLTLVVHLMTLAEGEFTQHFRDFLATKYGREMRNALERLDMGPLYMGSFGGRTYKDQEISNRPVIFVHGVTLRAGAFLDHRKFFMSNGYTSAELYATTYSDGGLSSLFVKKMECKDVKQIRNFILAVASYTRSKVDIIAYSMGTAISRKAILGGQCVETLEQLGESLTDIIDTYVAVGGVAYGFEPCTMNEKNWPACNGINGMVYTSKYLKDLNNQSSRYEAQHSYSIYSKDDALVGQNCGHPCSELNHANLTITKHGYDHVTIFSLTKELQYTLLKYKISNGL